MQDGSKEVSFPVQLCLVGALSLSMLVRVTCMEICFFASVRVQNNVRSVLVHAIFRKSLCVPDHELDVGRISNLMATDADKIGKWSSLLFSLSQWSWTFASLPFLVYFLYQLVGASVMSTHEYLYGLESYLAIADSASPFLIGSESEGSCLCWIGYSRKGYSSCQAIYTRQLGWFVAHSAETLEVGSAAFIGTAMVVLGAAISRGLGRCLQSWTKATSRASTASKGREG